MTRWLHRWLVVLPLLTGCAGRGSGASTPQADRTPSAAQVYTVGEEQFAAGHYPEAVQLWRHAVLELPATSDFDELRHEVLMRLAYGQLMAWQQTGNPGFLEDAQLMLERYARRHEQLFGETEATRAQRDEIYELLSEVELRLDPPQIEGLEEDPMAEDPMLALVSEIEAEAETQREEGEGYRLVVVKRERPSVDDPNMRRLLNSRFTDPFDPRGVLTGPDIVLMHGPRPMLRAGGFARPAEGSERSASARRHARKLGSSLLAAARPALKSCYEAAFARQPTDVARSTVEVQIDEEGRVEEATIVEGGLVDTLGDLCLVERLESTRVEHTAAAEQATIRVPLTFFYEGPVVFDEATGSSAPAGVIDKVRATPGGATPGPDGSSLGGPSRGA